YRLGPAPAPRLLARVRPVRVVSKDPIGPRPMRWADVGISASDPAIPDDPRRASSRAVEATEEVLRLRASVESDARLEDLTASARELDDRLELGAGTDRLGHVVDEAGPIPLDDAVDDVDLALDECEPLALEVHLEACPAAV